MEKTEKTEKTEKMEKITLIVKHMMDGNEYEVKFDEDDGPDEIEDILTEKKLFREGDQLLLSTGVISGSLGRLKKKGKLKEGDTILVGTITNGGKFNLL